MPPSVRGAGVYAALLQSMLVGLGYAATAPLVLPMCLLYFVTTYCVWRYSVLYVYERQYESGGRMWTVVLGQVGVQWRSIIRHESRAVCSSHENAVHRRDDARALGGWHGRKCPRPHQCMHLQLQLTLRLPVRSTALLHPGPYLSW